MPTSQHRKFDLGVNQDENSGVLAEGYHYSSKNMLYDKIGITRKRGGITGLGATAIYAGDQIGVLVRDDGTQQLYSGGYVSGFGHSWFAINQTTGVLSGLFGLGGQAIPDAGRPFSHYGFLMWPNYNADPAASFLKVTAVAVAGATGASAYNFVTPASVVLTAGDKRVACAAADNPLVNLSVGQIFSLCYGTASEHNYTGRVTRLVSTTAFEVYPTPVAASANSQAATALSNFASFINETPTFGQILPDYVGSKVGMSFQGRVVLGNLSIYNSGGFGRIELDPRAVAFSTSLLEQPISHIVSIPPNSQQGATWLVNEGYQILNRFRIPPGEQITAMSPTGFGDAVIFSFFRSFRLTGNLTTQYGTDQSITWDVREIPNSVGCMSERSMQRTPRGIVFAHDSGVYATDGSSMHPLMFKKMSDYWKGLQGTSFRIYGSALVRGNHYYICGVDGSGASWGLMCNLDTLAWGPLSGKAAAPASWLINSAVQDAVDSSRTWALKWWDSGGAAPSMAGGQLLKLESLFTPTSANRADSDGTTVNFEVVTRPYSEDSPTVQKDWVAATVQYNNKGGAGVGVTPGFVLESEDMPASVTNTTPLPRQDVYTVTAGTNAGVIIVLTIGAGHTIAQDSWVRVTGATGNTAANGIWRVQAVTGTTVTLMGSIGNGVFGGACTVQNVDERDISLQNAIPIGGNPVAVVYRFNDTDLGTGGADEFELLGITHTWNEHDPHVE